MKPKRTFLIVSFSLVGIFAAIVLITGWPATKTLTAEQKTSLTAKRSISEVGTSPVSPDLNSLEDKYEKNAKPSSKLTGHANVLDQPLTTFSKWLDDYTRSDLAEKEQLYQQGLDLAKARKLIMADLIQTNPALAIEHAVSYHAYEQLPQIFRSFVEKPFTTRANILVLPDETGEAKGREITFLETTENGYQVNRVSLYGDRRNMLSKNNIAVQGIVLDDLAAVSDKAIQILRSKEDQQWAKEHLENNPSNSSTDFLTGEQIPGEPVLAVAGGRIFYFANEKNVQDLNKKLANLEQEIGPHKGSQVLFLRASGGTDTFVAAFQDIDSETDFWTETPKKVFMIRVDFSDYPGDPVSKAELLITLKAASYYIQNFSYGKTWIEGDVSDQVVRLPKPGTYYYNMEKKYPKEEYRGSRKLLGDAKEAFNKLYTGIDLTDYDIVGVCFTDLDFNYAGLGAIGGTELLLQGYDRYSTLGTLVHELGHNYGLCHANYWDTRGRSVVGTGSEEPYGDIFDTMGRSFFLGHFHMLGKSRLKWLTRNQWVDVTTSGKHRIYRFDHAEALGTQALRIQKNAGEYYWLGYRCQFQIIKRLEKWLENSAYIIWQTPETPFSRLIDTTPGSEMERIIDTTPGSELDKIMDSRLDAGIAIGRTYSDTVAGVHITTIGRGGTAPNQWLDVQVNYGDFPQNTAPEVTMGIPDALKVGIQATLTAYATDDDGDVLAYYWDTGDGEFHNNANAIIHSWKAGGEYTIKVIVSDMKGGTTSQELSVTVSDPTNEDTDNDKLVDSLESSGCTDPLDSDTDDDGILDGDEDSNGNGLVDVGETNPCDSDTDSDGIQDGTELCYTLADIGPDTDLSVFQPDLDPETTTDPLKEDTNEDGLTDGEEDSDFNGRVDEEETDPNSDAALKKLYFPHIASSAIWETEICLINKSPSETIHGRLVVYENSGVKSAENMLITLPPHARKELTIGNEYANPIDIGYAVFLYEKGAVSGYTKFYTSGKYRVAVPATDGVNTDDIYISHIASNSKWWTGVSLLNTTGEQKNLTIEFDDGSTISKTIAANEHQAFTIKSLFQKNPQPDINSAIIKNGDGIIGLELFGSYDGSGNSYLSGVLLKDDTATTIYYPHIASNSLWWTGLVAYNPSTTSCDLAITPFTADGVPLAPQLISLAGQEKYIGSAKALNFPGTTEWFKIEASNPITGFELFGTRNGNQLGGYTGVGLSSASGIFPKIENNGGWTEIAFVNIENEPTTATITAYDDSGNSIAAKTLNLNAYEKVFAIASDLFSQDIGTATYITYSSAGDVVGFQFNGSSDDMLLDVLPCM